MLNTKEREQLAKQRTPTDTTQKTIPRLSLGAWFYWFALAVITPLFVPVMVLMKELTKPFKRQRY